MIGQNTRKIKRGLNKFVRKVVCNCVIVYVYVRKYCF